MAVFTGEATFFDAELDDAFLLCTFLTTLTTATFELGLAVFAAEGGLLEAPGSLINPEAPLGKVIVPSAAAFLIAKLS